jgi:hypothetical protein
MINRLKHIVLTLRINKTASELDNVFLKFARGEDFMWQRSEREVKVVIQPLAGQLGRLGYWFPDPWKVGREGWLQVGEGGGADVIADYEEEEGARWGAGWWDELWRRREVQTRSVLVLGPFTEETEVDLEDGLEQTHVRPLI